MSTKSDKNDFHNEIGHISGCIYQFFIPSYILASLLEVSISKALRNCNYRGFCNIEERSSVFLTLRSNVKPGGFLLLTNGRKFSGML